jgi:hypothetical protein
MTSATVALVAALSLSLFFHGGIQSLISYLGYHVTSYHKSLDRNRQGNLPIILQAKTTARSDKLINMTDNEQLCPPIPFIIFVPSQCGTEYWSTIVGG